LLFCSIPERQLQAITLKRTIHHSQILLLDRSADGHFPMRSLQRIVLSLSQLSVTIPLRFAGPVLVVVLVGEVAELAFPPMPASYIGVHEQAWPTLTRFVQSGAQCG
jgi:hypothetical protein